MDVLDRTCVWVSGGPAGVRARLEAGAADVVKALDLPAVVFVGHSVSAMAGELVKTMDGHLGRSAHTAPVVIGTPDRPELGDELVSDCRTDPTTAD